MAKKTARSPRLFIQARYGNYYPNGRIGIEITTKTVKVDSLAGIIIPLIQEFQELMHYATAAEAEKDVKRLKDFVADIHVVKEA